MTLQTFLRILLRRWWLVALATLLTAASTAFFVMREPPVYRATAAIEVTPGPQLQSSAELNDAIDALDKHGMLNTIAHRLSTQAAQEQVAAALQVPVSAVASANMGAFVIPDMYVIEIRAQSTKPDLAAALANAGADALVSRSGDKLFSLNVSDRASPPSAPIGPAVGRMISLGIVTGLVLGVIFTLLLHVLQPIGARRRPAETMQIPMPADDVDGLQPHLAGSE